MQYIKTLDRVLKEFIGRELEKLKTIDLFVVKEVNEDNLTCTLERLNVGTLYENVELSGIGLGNGCGLFKVPEVGEILVCGYIQNSENIVILTSLFDTITNNPDNKPDVKRKELFLSNQINGATILLRNDNSIVIRATNGAKAKLESSGQFKLFNNQNYGIESNFDGKVVIYGDVEVYGSTNFTDSEGGNVSAGSKQIGNF